ncbi:transposase [Hydrogenophaga sp. 5NK40-0174]|uniref:transposase n=1 Tax=Hydrogenophaga sp. 5NK40-0174 TaxID=3127649 RepID=UPI003107412C
MLWDALAQAAEQHGVQIHAYALLPTQFQLLATPTLEGGISRMMQGVGRRFVTTFNQRHSIHGAMWDGRYRSNLVEEGDSLLACMVFLDTLPVAAGLCHSPERYEWTSHQDFVGLRQDRRVVPHESYWRLGNTPFAREAAYADLVHAGLSARTAKVIEESALHGWPYGSSDFLAELSKLTGRRLRPLTAGRPPRGKKSSPQDI